MASSEYPDPLGAERLARARGLAEALTTERNYPVSESDVREIAAEIVKLLSAAPVVPERGQDEAERRFETAWDRLAGNVTEAMVDTAYEMLSMKEPDREDVRKALTEVLAAGSAQEEPKG